ncbi:PREDICTED: uncharacterized protein LOC108615791 [Drosophila arizonae]|uniref:Uncharacterized protein LOC108615791 n=1 Tax=Drosophila arizonae TaxID=7263 RepID=A0ABM1PFR7_DROAR|nr:PREDICTED: uncharacterized protein LOC108615791 [Drosophila arizonae]
MCHGQLASYINSWKSVTELQKLSKMLLPSLLLLTLQMFCHVLAVDYEMLIDDPDVFTDCLENPPGAKGASGLFNLDELTFSLNGDKIHVEGNVTTVWDVEPTDRITASARLMQLDRGIWQPTVFSIATQDFCSLMYDKDQYWFKYWTRYVEDMDAMKSKCVNHKGTKLVHSPFDINMVLTNVRGTTLHGRYKIVVTLEAFDDEKNVKRPESICMEIIGDCERL